MSTDGSRTSWPRRTARALASTILDFAATVACLAFSIAILLCAAGTLGFTGAALLRATSLLLSDGAPCGALQRALVDTPGVLASQPLSRAQTPTGFRRVRQG